MHKLNKISIQQSNLPLENKNLIQNVLLEVINASFTNVLLEINGKIEVIELGDNRFISLGFARFSILFYAMVTEYGDQSSLAKLYQNRNQNKEKKKYIQRILKESC